MKNLLLVATFFLTSVPVLGNAKEPMAELYEYVITDIYDEAIREKYLLDGEIMYMYGYSSSREAKIDRLQDYYQFELPNDRICFRSPSVEQIESENIGTVYGVFWPELSGEYVTISVVPFVVGKEVIDEEETIILENGGSIRYFFKYNPVQKKWKFHKKETYGI